MRTRDKVYAIVCKKSSNLEQVDLNLKFTNVNFITTLMHWRAKYSRILQPFSTLTFANS